MVQQIWNNILCQFHIKSQITNLNYLIKTNWSSTVDLDYQSLSVFVHPITCLLAVTQQSN